ncbi:hypothetical protein ACS0TY_022256 [Phlomoides rotata]
MKMGGVRIFVYLVLLISLFGILAKGEIPGNTQRLINEANQNGPYLGLVIPNLFELNPLLQHPSYTPTNLTIDFAGRRFRFGTVAEEKVILVMTGLAMINAGITTQLLLSLFNVKGVVHYGIAGNANPSLHIGDVAIPQYWSHSALWNWQRYGNGPENELPLEPSGDYTREIGHIKIAEYSTKGVQLENCLNATECLSYHPKVVRVSRGTSASIYLDNAAYRSFIYDKFQVSPVEMESAAIALVCHQQRVPFIIFRALSDLAGGGSAESNEADAFTPLAATNSVVVVVEFIKRLGGVKAVEFA